ncbi:hypothetical protein [Pedobacter mendelii]|uniref:DUF4136 domain-containing protein n=1 Tax=Pedobacter mendelii TaxID=1908240 RepID=A0ABQ2BJ32_9SPHI|nr:hypothetical protein [Pedobacter mendelii]GGI25205.1 hypothetical protein GCM10008119_16490 [Pedobacter mendelii]
MKIFKVFISVAILYVLIAQKLVYAQSTKPQPDEKYKPLSSYSGDTSLYIIENFVTNQAFYKQKPLNVLLNRLEVPIKDFVYGSDTDDHEYTTHVSITAYQNAEIERKVKLKKEPAILVIYWTKSVKILEVTQVVRKNQGVWNKDLADFFGEQVIDHIGYVKYPVNK